MISPKKSIVINSIIFGAISILIVIFVVLPLFWQVKEESINLTSVSKDLMLSKDKADNIEKIKNTYSKWEPDLNKIDVLLVDPDVPIGLIESWESDAYSSMISLDIFSAFPKVTETDSFSSSLNFQMSAAGSFSGFLNFLTKLETSPYLIEIQNLSIKRLDKNDLSLDKYKMFNSGDVIASMMLKVFTK